MAGEGGPEKGPGHPAYGQGPAPLKLAREKKRRQQQRPQIPHAMHERAKRNQRRQPERRPPAGWRGPAGFPVKEDDQQPGDRHDEGPAEGESSQDVRGQARGRQRGQPGFRPLQPRQRRPAGQDKQGDDAKNHQPFGVAPAPEVELPQDQVPAVVVVDFEDGPHHQNLRPRLAAHRLGRVPQGVIRRKIAVLDDPQRDEQDD